MAQTIAGGKLAAATNKAKYGSDFYKKIGAMGGRAAYCGEKGFASMSRERRVECGRQGGTISRRGPAKQLPRTVRVEFIPPSWFDRVRQYLKGVKV